MGCCAAVALPEEQKSPRKRHKVLFLGPGGSGKSTLFKQLRQLYGTGFVPRDRADAKYGISEFVIETMKFLLNESTFIKEELSCTDAKQAATNIEQIGKTEGILLSHEIANDIKILWAEQQIKEIFEIVAKLHLNGPCAYFFDDIDRISDDNYQPTNKDILFQRRSTSGIIEQIIESKNEEHEFQIVDVGGQHNERRKWMHHFDNVAALVFVVSLASYDEPLFEDENINSLHDSLQLWEKTINDHVFDGTLIYLIFNKEDIFRQKIVQMSMYECFESHPDIFYDENEMYLSCETDDEKIEKNLEFYKKIYLDLCSREHLVQDTYVTCAYDENVVKHVFDRLQNALVEDEERMKYGRKKDTDDSVIEMSDGRDPNIYGTSH